MSSPEIRDGGGSVGFPVEPDERSIMLTRLNAALDGPDVASIDLTIPGYEILDRIHDGAMGTVFRARQISVDRIVAIKVLRADLARDAELVERFCRESLIGAQLSHPNIVSTIDAGMASGRPYLVMEYLPGLTLHQVLEERGPCDESTALRIAMDVASALRFLHQRGLAHRDIKPANIILTPEGLVKLVDLGLARPLEDETWAVAEAGMAVGTPEYMSPEQTRGQSDLDIRSDLYSLGATLFHLVTGRVPYGGESVAEAMQRHASARIPLPAPESLNADLTSGLSAIVRKLMARNREDRYRNPDDLIFDLARMLRGARPAIAEFPPEAFAPLAVGEAAAAASSPNGRPLDGPAPQPRREADDPFPTGDADGGLPAWLWLLLLSGMILSLLTTAALILIVVSG
jgi:serine/threonine protein kinase